MTAPTDDSPQPAELEIKFAIPPGAEAAVAAHPALQGDGAGAAGPRRTVTTYFDTPAADLARMGASLRIRRDEADGRRVQTLKLRETADGGTPFRRGEWEWPVEEDVPETARLGETPLLARLGEAGPPRFVPVFAVEVSRTIRHLTTEGGTVVEAALDRGALRAGDATEEICELELELKQGDAAALYRLAAALHADLPLTIGAESKADRGWRLRTGHARAPQAPPGIPLPRDVAPTEALRRIVEASLGNLLANQPAAAAGEVEGVHRMRTAIRRLRAALSLFRPRLEPRAAARLKEVLREQGRILGEARDWDVFCTETLAAAEQDGVPPPLLDLLRVPAEAERAAAHARLANAFAAPPFTAMVLGLAAWAEEPGLAGSGRRPLVEVAPALARRLENKVLRRHRRLRKGKAPEAAALHRLRKASRALRYAVEFLAPLHADEATKAYRKACKALQSRLGEVNDAATAVALAERLGGARRAELAPALAALATWADRRRATALGRLPKAWRRFKAASLPG
jgi:inorganic triphosphatase YgiF